MSVRLPKIVHPSNEIYQYVEDNKVKAFYHPNLPIDDTILLKGLESLPFTRVMYISRFGKKNRTPRKTWAFGKVDSDVVTYTKRGFSLNFEAEPMPPWLNWLSDYCRQFSVLNWGFDPGYNSVIIGKYENRDDAIAFHFDTETFLAHHFCANVTIGYARDFQFRDKDRRNHEIQLENKSVFFFEGLEHALPKRAAVKSGDVRYSISFRNMNKDRGIANSYYYCRGVDGARDDEDKLKYVAELNNL